MRAVMLARLMIMSPDNGPTFRELWILASRIYLVNAAFAKVPLTLELLIKA